MPIPKGLSVAEAASLPEAYATSYLNLFLEGCLEAGQTAFIPAGIAMEVPVGCAGLIYARSGLACKRGLAPANKVGVVDSDYRGQIMVALHNHGAQQQTIAHGERVAQMVITPVLTPPYTEVEELTDSDRGTGGFGSTGR